MVDFTPENLLEEALVAMAADPEKGGAFDHLLLTSPLHVIGQNEGARPGEDQQQLKAGSQVRLIAVRRGDTQAIPVFTAPSRLATFYEKVTKSAEIQRYITMPGRTLFQMANGADFLLNPGSIRPAHGRRDRAAWAARMTMPKVLIADKLQFAAVAIFKERGVEADVKTDLPKDELLKIVDQYDGSAIRSATKITADVIKAATRRKVVGRAGIGVDNVDIPAATAAGVSVMCTPFGNSITTAEHAIALMMALAREPLPPMPRPMPASGRRTASWDRNSTARPWA